MARSLTIALRVTASAVALSWLPDVALSQEGPAPSPVALDVLAAEAAGQVEVRFIPNDSRSGQVVVVNRDDRPLTLRLPSSFAGVPVAAQFGAGGMGGGMGMGNNAVQPFQQQPVGGGGVQGGPGMPGGGLGAGGFCWVAREVYGVHDPRWLAFREWMIWEAPLWLQRVYANHGEAIATWLRSRPAARVAVRLMMDQAISAAQPASSSAQFNVVNDLSPTTPFTVASGKSLTIRVPLVCLAYGLKEPTPRTPYRLTALATVSQDPRLAVLLGGLASGHLSQPVTQAAAWHVASGRTWEQLATEVVKGFGGFPDQPVFSAADLQAARQAVEIATRVTSAGRTAESEPVPSPSN